MIDEDLDGASVMLVVAQQPFEASSEGGVWNTFATLLPVLYDDGRRARPEEFPDNKDVWWMVLPGKRGLAEPGRLITGTLETSKNAGQPGKAYYQVRPDSVEAAGSAHLVELIDVPDDWVTEPRGLVTGNRTLPLDHPPLGVVYVLWRGHLYGPLRASAEPAGADTGDWVVKLAPRDEGNTVLQVPEKALEALSPARDHRVELEVSLTNQAPVRTHHTHLCRYRLILAEDFKAVIPPGATRLHLRSEEDVLREAAKRLLSRSKRQQLQQLLELFRDMMTSEAARGGTAAEAVEIIEAMRGRLDAADRHAEELSRTLLDSGSLTEQIERAQKAAEAEHVEKHAARLRTEIDEKVHATRAALTELENKKQGLADELESLRRKNLAQLEREQAQKQKEFEQSLRDQEERLDGQKRELERQRDLLSKNLKQVAAQLAENRDGLVNQFLAISPLLRQLDLMPSGGGGGERAPALANGVITVAPVAGPKPRFEPPAFVAGRIAAKPVSEVEFFDRFVRHVEASGFKHRRLDLAAFHLSVKCNDLTILGGLPGTGKSSLPRLYVEALAGDEREDGQRRYLHVGVSPSWLDMRDLLGHTNSLDRCFQPAESGLYQHLVCAQEEEARAGLDARPYVVCLDEMNLAQVEHYFSGFIMALALPPGKREIRCFSPQVVAADDPFAAWPTLNLPRNLRFVGTVNFDETTRQLSQRVLDRANLIRLRPSYLLDAEDPAPAQATGAPVALRQFRDWVASSPKLDRSLGELIDKLREPLTRLGCPLNPRRFNAIRKFIGSAPPEVCKPEEALDLQIAQRVLPQVRNLFRPGAQEALDALKKTLETQPAGFPESLHWLEDVRAGGFPTDLFAGGESE